MNAYLKAALEGLAVGVVVAGIYMGVVYYFGDASDELVETIG